MNSLKDFSIRLADTATSVANVENLKKAARKAGNHVRDAMRQDAPRKLGRLASSIVTSVREATQDFVVTQIGPKKKAQWLARILTKGAQPHLIKPNPRRKTYTGRLRLRGGQIVESVQHPGFKGNPFIERSFDRSKEEAAVVFAKELDALIMKGFKNGR